MLSSLTSPEVSGRFDIVAQAEAPNKTIPPNKIVVNMDLMEMNLLALSFPFSILISVKSQRTNDHAWALSFNCSKNNSSAGDPLGGGDFSRPDGRPKPPVSSRAPSFYSIEYLTDLANRGGVGKIRYIPSDGRSVLGHSPVIPILGIKIEMPDADVRRR